jgi:hypothetical protein
MNFIHYVKMTLTPTIANIDFQQAWLHNVIEGVEGWEAFSSPWSLKKLKTQEYIFRTL